MVSVREKLEEKDMGIFSKISMNAENNYLEMVEAFLGTSPSFKNLEKILNDEGTKFQEAMKEIKNSIAVKGQKFEREKRLLAARSEIWQVAKYQIRRFDESKESIEKEWKGILQLRENSKFSQDIFDYNAKAFEDFLNKMRMKFGISFLEEKVYCDPLNEQNLSKVKVIELPQFKGPYEEYRKLGGWSEWNNYSDGICCFLLNIKYEWDLSNWLLETTGRIQKGDIPADSLRELMKYAPL